MEKGWNQNHLEKLGCNHHRKRVQPPERVRQERLLSGHFVPIVTIRKNMKTEVVFYHGSC
jgi:hypothetical protein